MCRQGGLQDRFGNHWSIWFYFIKIIRAIEHFCKKSELTNFRKIIVRPSLYNYSFIEETLKKKKTSS